MSISTPTSLALPQPKGKTVYNSLQGLSVQSISQSWRHIWSWDYNSQKPSLIQPRVYSYEGSPQVLTKSTWEGSPQVLLAPTPGTTLRTSYCWIWDGHWTRTGSGDRGDCHWGESLGEGFVTGSSMLVLKLFNLLSSWLPRPLGAITRA